MEKHDIENILNVKYRILSMCKNINDVIIIYMNDSEACNVDDACL